MQRDDGFMDWVDQVREHMSNMAERAQDAQRLGQEKWEELRTKKEAEELLLELGEIHYLNATQGPDSFRDQQAQRVVDELVGMQQDGVLIDLRDGVKVDAPPSRL